jgi:hypothetical protein
LGTLLYTKNLHLIRVRTLCIIARHLYVIFYRPPYFIDIKNRRKCVFIHFYVHIIHNCRHRVFFVKPFLPIIQSTGNDALTAGGYRVFLTTWFFLFLMWSHRWKAPALPAGVIRVLQNGGDHNMTTKCIAFSSTGFSLAFHLQEHATINKEK